MAKATKKFRFGKRSVVISTASAAVLIVAALVIWHYHTRPSQVVLPISPIKNSLPSASGNPNIPAGSGSSVPNKSTPSSGGYSSTSNTTSSSGPAPLTPTGPFISNHGSSQYPAGDENSVCNTTPGASCYIKFTNGNSTLQLEAGTANSNGSVFWEDWNVKSYNFTSGQWTITAVATLNGQTTTATDGTPLTIQ